MYRVWPRSEPTNVLDFSQRSITRYFDSGFVFSCSEKCMVKWFYSIK